MKSDYTGGPLPSPSASHTRRLEQHHAVVLLFTRRKHSGRFCRRESVSKGKPGHLKLHRYKWRGSKPSMSLFTLFFFQILNVPSDCKLNHDQRNAQHFFHFTENFFPSRLTILAKRLRSRRLQKGLGTRSPFPDHLLHDRHGLREFTYTQVQAILEVGININTLKMRN